MSTVLRNGGIVSSAGVVRAPLHIVGDRVAATAPPGAHEIDLRDHLIFPGLVNAHDHLQINNIPPLPRATPFANSYEWAAALQSHLALPSVTAARRVPAATRYQQGGLKNLLCGATTVAHHDPWHPVLDEPAFPVNLLRSFGWCHSLGLAPDQGDARPWLSLARRAGRILLRRPGLGPYGPAALASFAATPRESPWIIHLAEGTDRVAAEELGQLERMGCLAPNTVLVHGVGLRARDVAKVIERRAAVVWCPASNLALLGATLDPRLVFEAGRLAIGSDSRLSGSRDLLDELRLAAVHCDLAPADIVHLATVGGSRVLGLPEVGGLAPGQRADFIVARDTGGDPYRTLLALERGDIRAVVLGGAPAIADGDLAEWCDAREVATMPVSLDGRPKLLARSRATLDAIALEPGLELRA
jgi:cytosine/adenosine deaminase-related metal-dependent hydrolase